MVPLRPMRYTCNSSSNSNNNGTCINVTANVILYVIIVTMQGIGIWHCSVVIHRHHRQHTVLHQHMAVDGNKNAQQQRLRIVLLDL
jgi:hypothetical protein